MQSKYNKTETKNKNCIINTEIYNAHWSTDNDYDDDEINVLFSLQSVSYL